MSNTLKSIRAAALGAVVAVALSPLASGLASAQTETSWTGPTPPYDGMIYLHNSSVSNDSGIVARTKLWTASGATVAPGYLGVRARLFKSGAVCEIAGYQFNTAWAASFENGTTASCGPGSYNSHGFIKVNSSSGTHEMFTFPSNPINFTGAATARSAAAAGAEVPSQTVTHNGKTYGPYNMKDVESQPDFVAAFADDGRLGYVSRAELDGASKAGAKLNVVSDQGSRIGTLTVK